MTIEKIKVADLKTADYNPRIMPDIELKALKDSIRTFGFVEPVVVNKYPERLNVLVGGHQRIAALQQMASGGEKIEGTEMIDGALWVPAIFVNLNLEHEKALNLALNKIRGKWDDDKLAGIISGLKESDVMPATGFREDEISRILDGLMSDDDSEPDEGDDLPPEALSKPGEVYDLGPHRLICGDSTNPATYEKLLGNERASMVFTDPPYNVAYKSRGAGLKDQGKESIQNDNMTAQAFKEFIDKAFASMFAWTLTGGCFYICSGWSSYPQFLDSMLKNGFRLSGVIIWVKNVASMGWNDYRYKHEWIGKAKKPDAKTAESIIYGWKNGTHQFYGENEYDVWDMPRKAVTDYLHPTEKPDWLAMRAIRNSSKRGEVILDPFGGSGSTLAACDKTGRRAFLIELDPKFCDVIRKRWARIEKQKSEN